MPGLTNIKLCWNGGAACPLKVIGYDPQISEYRFKTLEYSH